MISNFHFHSFNTGGGKKKYLITIVSEIKHK